MQLLTVSDKNTEQCFLDVPRKIYRNDPNWACVPDAEIKGIFRKETNKKLDYGEAVRWVLKSDNGELIGRIAAFYDKRRAFKEQPYAGGIGFFECIDQFEAAKILFDEAHQWLKSKGMEAMDGPVNFGENYVHQGLLVDGFMPQGFGMPYNKPYYRALFEQYGFRNYFEMYSYHLNLTRPLPQRQERFARHLLNKPDYQLEHFRFSNYTKYLDDIVTIYNGVWSHFHDDYIPLEFDEMEKMLMEVKPLLNEEFIWFIYHDQKPIGMLVAFPDLNQILRKLDGKLDFIGKIRFVFAKLTTKITRARLLVAGVLPDYQQTGIVAAAYLRMIDQMRKRGIQELESSWVGDYNNTVNQMYRMLGSERAKTHVTYRFLFDRNAPFTRFMSDS
ncbi:MAG: GNAT family N-acetyltransferase [Salinivirgaceae bacterium]|jgi:hypothetical protein|nr:GNAT family N-acetyltransferase [Salinivirgaceae bacterium]